VTLTFGQREAMKASRTGKDDDGLLPDRLAAMASAPGPIVQIRQAAVSDRPALAQMVARCSEQTLVRRFHKHVRSIPEPYLTEALSRCPGHFALVAQVGETNVALASCVADAGGAEVVVLVEDSWQHMGVGPGCCGYSSRTPTGAVCPG
jgi:hypothetical protein